jgi:hypothetical protein
VEHHVDVFEASHLRDVFWQSGSKKAPLTPRPPFQTQAVRRRARGRQAHPRLARRRQGERRHGEGGVTRRSRTSTRDQRTASHRARRTCTTIYCTLKTFHLVEKRVVENAHQGAFRRYVRRLVAGKGGGAGTIG